MSLSERRLNLFCDVDDFCQIFLPLWQMTLIQPGLLKRVREPDLSMSETMTIIFNSVYPLGWTKEG